MKRIKHTASYLGHYLTIPPMQRLSAALISLSFLLLLSACGGSNFEEASIPEDQLNTEFSFRRLANHGELEAVVEIGQLIKDWQFYVGANSKVSVLGSPETIEYRLSDRSGIAYTVSSESTDQAILEKLEMGTYGYATGSFVAVERDLAEGKIYATIRLESWKQRTRD